MLALKLKYKCDDENFYEDLIGLRKKYSNCLHIFVNRLIDSSGNITEKDLRSLSSNLNNIPTNSFIIQSCARESISLYKSYNAKEKEHDKNLESDLKKLDIKKERKKITERPYWKKKKALLKDIKLIFGGKNLNNERQKHNISNEEYKFKKMSPFYSMGEALHKGNRLFTINTDLSILFKPDKNHHYVLKLSYGTNQEKILKELCVKGLNKELAITYKLDHEYIYIIYDESKLYGEFNHDVIDNRVLAVDMNPDYIGWSIVDWKSSSEYNVIESGVYSFKYFSDELNKLNKLRTISSDDERRLYLHRKRETEVINCAKNLIEKSIYYKCQIISIEDLNIKSSDKDKGKNYNRLCNNTWLRSTFVNQLKKRCNIFRIKLLEVKPEYSSFIGNLVFRQENKPDMVLSSIEIGRRAYEFYNQYIIKTKEIKKNIVQPNKEDFINNMRMSLEELNLEGYEGNFIELYSDIKSKNVLSEFNGNTYKVRIMISDLNLSFKRFLSKNSLVQII